MRSAGLASCIRMFRWMGISSLPHDTGIFIVVWFSTLSEQYFLKLQQHIQFEEVCARKRLLTLTPVTHKLSSNEEVVSFVQSESINRNKDYNLISISREEGYKEEQWYDPLQLFLLHFVTKSNICFHGYFHANNYAKKWRSRTRKDTIRHWVLQLKNKSRSSSVLRQHVTTSPWNRDVRDCQ